MAFLNKTSKPQNPSLRNTRHRQPPEPVSPKLAGLFREAKWLGLVGLALYLAMVLFSYDQADPSWSHSGSRLTVHNAGGEMGAWLADMLLYIYGLSAYWWVAFALYVVWWGYRRIESAGLSDRRSLFVATTGFILLIFASSGLEALRFYSLKAALPLAPGGMIGAVVSGAMSRGLGFTGATLVLLLSMAAGFSLFTGMSWLKFMEGLGAAIEGSYQWIIQTWDAWKDRRAGSVALNQREEVVAEEKKRFDEHKPIHIEQPVADIPQIPLTEREVQAPLFDNLPDSPLPPLNLLDEAEADTETLSADTLEFTSRLIERKLADFGVVVKVIAAYPGPVITRYEIEPAVGVKGSQITNLVRDLARALSVVSIRLVETIPGKNCMGLEIPNPKRQVVRLREILGSKVYADMASPLTIAMGKDIAGKAVVADLAKMPHVLVAGTTGSGKSVAINAMILSLVYKADPAKVRLILVDPKMLELSVYEGIPHLLAPVVTDMKHAANALNWCVAEMERRYRLMSALGVRNLAGYNQAVREGEKSGAKKLNPFSLTPDAPEPLEELPFIVVLIDELADMMMMVGKKVEELIARLAQKARASGIHLVLATQRPSVDVITGLIKANIPTRVAFQVSSKIDSRTILDQMGAEALLGQGDMLYLPPGTGYPQRVHGAYVADHEVHKVVDYLKALGAPDYVEGILDAPEVAGEGEGGEAGGDAEADPMYDQAVALVLKSRRASISLVQRQLRIGYNRAARLIEQMERAGLVSAMQSNGNREVLVKGAE
ncbi:MAG TPA: DNA translocase FtsK 4TM domain-containing protein [Sulfuricella sp.]|nr:DNA translocase FtsK 4TM domain-containing protein [Sulfuricella sp.]